MKNFLYVLLLAFIVAKIANLVAWSWWIVFIPAYILAVPYIISITIIIFVGAIAILMNHWED